MGAVRDERVKSLVYIAALAPQEGETVAELFYRTPPHAEAPQLQPDPQGWLWMPEQGFVHAVAHRASADQAAIMHAVQRPIAVACIQQRAPAPAWQGMPCWYLLAEQDRMISPDNQRFMANRMGATIRSLDVDHTPMYTAPDVVVELIRTAAREA
jgi:pimeloyl-ACP methyl ester carboxylesterase